MIEKKINLFFTTTFLVFMIAFWSIVMGIYMTNQWKHIRDIRRSTDISTIQMAISVYVQDFNALPDNISLDAWDYGYKLKNESKFVLYNLFEKGIFDSPIFDPLNDHKYYYRYHKFNAGEYGCEESFAIFQVSSFETESSNHGSGSCPKKDFVSDAPNGYTMQWFLKN